ncbi:MAG: helix-turn-helix domain-containing protein [Candidatus Dormibacteria bacterium]
MAESRTLPGMGGRIIRTARERKGLTQGELAHAAGMAQGLISRYEAGLVEPTMKTIQRLVNAAGVVMTIEVDGIRMIDTTRFPTDEEAAAIEAWTRRLAGDPAPGTWKRKLSGFKDVGPAFPRRSRDGA